MKKLILLLTLFVWVVGCKETPNKQEAQETETTETVAETTPQEEEWTVLFDGSSFDNWRGYLSEEMHPEWSIQDDGSMLFTPGEEGGKNIISKETYTNFVLSLEWKISEGGNSGIFWGVHEDEKFKEAYETAPEIQVLDDEKHPDSFVGEGTHKAGALYDLIAPKEGAVKPAGEWNLCEIEINHATNQGKASLNGVELFTFPVHGPDWDAMIADSKFADWEGFGKYQTGHIGLQDHSDKVWYRNIKIKELK
ncbi:MAG: DUF1080 domain-containing protein [Aureisphaera sp.]